MCAWIGDIYTAQSERGESPQSHLLSTQLSLHSQAHPSARSHTTLPHPTLMERGKRKRCWESEKERDSKQLREREGMAEHGGEKEKIKQFHMHLQVQLACEEEGAINSLMLKMQNYPTAYALETNR